MDPPAFPQLLPDVLFGARPRPSPWPYRAMDERSALKVRTIV
ncbi:hypothetical protein ACFYRY_23040 [Streptomyces sp. NPDC005263]